jgi:hypothetical protein
METARRYALWARLVVTALYLAGIVQFLLAGYGFFEGKWGAHEGLGWSLMHGLPLLTLIVTLVIWRRGPTCGSRSRSACWASPSRSSRQRAGGRAPSTH